MDINIDFKVKMIEKKCGELAIVPCSLNSTDFKSVSTYTDIFKWVFFCTAFRARPQLK